MKVACAIWATTLSMCWLVSGRSIEQLLLTGKLALLGFILGFVGGKIAEGIHTANSKPAVARRR